MNIQDSVIESEGSQLPDIEEQRDSGIMPNDRSTIYQDRTAMMSRPDVTMDRGRSQYTRNQTYDAGPSFMMSNSQVGRFPEASFSEEPLDEDIIRKNNAGIDVGGHMDS